MPANPDLDDLKGFEQLSEAERLAKLVELAHTAPSSHNSQPWLFRISNQTIEILGNTQRRLLGSDKFDREYYLSLGAVVGALDLAAQSFGLNYNVIQGAGEVVARFEFHDLNPSQFDRETLQALVNRHSNRNKFEQKPILDNFLQFLSSQSNDKVQLQAITDIAAREQTAEIVLDSIEAAFKDKEFTSELSVWIKPSLAKYEDGLVGYNVGIPWLLSFVMPWMIKNMDVSLPQRKMNEPLLKSAPAFVVISAASDDREHWIEAGRMFERIAVEAEKNGIKVGVFGSVIEIGEYYKKLAEVIGQTGRPLMFFRIGYNDFYPKKSPRLALHKIILSQ